ncbi:MAG TPA: UDP-N-acetylglucosamine 1-carboxyvinyltransferase, partial [Ruminococcaceae bacterium]|nr:UDP-N-acetylglucosamine 1-carboxyvinyltransferase [Oscillospiraceae bacterium]
AAMIIAGLAAHGVTKIEDIEHIQRGYEDIVEKFVGLGADMYLMLDPTNSDTAKIG